MKKLNVMHVILNMELAGAQEVVRTLVEYQQNNDCVLTVCAFQDGPMRPKIEALGVNVEILNRPYCDIIKLPMFLSELKRIRRELIQLAEKYQTDVIQTHLLEVLDFVCLSLRGDASIKAVIWTVHNVEILPTMPGRLLPAKRIVYRQLYHHLSQRVDNIIAVSDEVGQAIVSEINPPASKISVINNGVDVKRYQQPGDKSVAQSLDCVGKPSEDCFTDLCRELNLSPEVNLLLTVGRLTEQKGHCYLIEAASKILSLHPQTHFLFVGEGELRTDLQNQANRFGHADKIHFLGNRNDVSALLAAADIFVLPSLWEGLSIALLEAMAAGKPIVATAVSGTSQVMTAEKHGLIVPAGDSSTLADAINRLLTNPAQAKSMGQAARQHVIANYSAEKQAEEHVALYRCLIDV
jgi:glycosyltransferase involved in cell wall biosynthesis